MSTTSTDTLARVFARLRQVQGELGIEPQPRDDPESLLADLIDSMGLVELLAVLAQERGVRSEDIERAAGNRFTTVASLAAALECLALAPRVHSSSQPILSNSSSTCCLSAVRAYLPRTIEESRELDQRLNRPPGWLESRAGIRRRHLWAGESPVDAAAETARASLASAGLLPEEIGGLLVTSQAPPLLAGLAAALHQRLELRPQAVALEVGGACTGFLQAVWLARNLTERVGAILIIALEAPSFHLTIQPGDAGETAALFGDGTACCIASGKGLGGSLSLIDVELSTAADDGLLHIEGSGQGGVCVRMDGQRLASRAVESLAEQVRQVAQRHERPLTDLEGIIIHGGNGRIPALVARRLGLPGDRVWSATVDTGNLGSASLPVAWALHGAKMTGTVAWAAIGAGLALASALTTTQPATSGPTA
jgi:3-oxoacyl-[acyl-carrier-protein] synthase-3